MDTATLILTLKARAADPDTRTDYKSPRRAKLPRTATLDEIATFERAWGNKLHPLHRRVLTEIADGGFGPGDGLVGVGREGADAHGRSLIELRNALWLDESTPLPPSLVPLCDWGDGIWSCLDESTGHVITLDESGLTDTEIAFESWLRDWVGGVDLLGKMFIFEQRTIINPFTKQPKTISTPIHAVGVAYERFPKSS